MVLCDLEGLTPEAAAGQLGCPIGTLGVRLMRAKQRLKDRLTRRGVSRADALLIAGPTAGPGSAVLPVSLVRSTVDVAVRLGSGGTVPTATAQLANGALRSMAMVRLAQVVAVSLAATLGVASLGAALGRPGPQAPERPAIGQAPESWIGKKVVLKYAAPLMEGDRVVYRDEKGRAYTVEQIDGERVELVADGVSWFDPELHKKPPIPREAADRLSDGVSGWVKAGDVVLLDQAIDFYTREIRANSKDIAARFRRAMVRMYQHEGARAMADLTEAIAIESSNARLYTARGMMLGDDGQPDKAIADLTEAVRLDPKSIIAYRERGRLWSQKEECNKAAADLTEVLHLDPRNAFAYRERGNAWCKLKMDDKEIADCTELIKLRPKDPWAYFHRGAGWPGKGDEDRAITDFSRAVSSFVL